MLQALNKKQTKLSFRASKAFPTWRKSFPP